MVGAIVTIDATCRLSGSRTEVTNLHLADEEMTFIFLSRARLSVVVLTQLDRDVFSLPGEVVRNDGLSGAPLPLPREVVRNDVLVPVPVLVLHVNMDEAVREAETNLCGGNIDFVADTFFRRWTIVAATTPTGKDRETSTSSPYDKIPDGKAPLKSKVVAFVAQRSKSELGSRGGQPLVSFLPTGQSRANNTVGVQNVCWGQDRPCEQRGVGFRVVSLPSLRFLGEQQLPEFLQSHDLVKL
eukprot:gene56748-biopygen7827